MPFVLRALYDPAAVPEWARESIASIARDHPETLPQHLYQVAEIEAARRHAAAHPVPPPPPPDNPRDFLHILAIDAWQALSRHQPAPDMDPSFLFQEMIDVFGADQGTSPVERLIDDWYDLARQCGINVNDEHDELRPDIDEAITRTVTAAVWFGITAGYLTLAGSYSTPRRLMPYFQRTGAGSRGGR